MPFSPDHWDDRMKHLFDRGDSVNIIGGWLAGIDDQIGQTSQNDKLERVLEGCDSVGDLVRVTGLHKGDVLSLSETQLGVKSFHVRVTQDEKFGLRHCGWLSLLK